ILKRLSEFDVSFLTKTLVDITVQRPGSEKDEALEMVDKRIGDFFATARTLTAIFDPGALGTIDEQLALVAMELNTVVRSAMSDPSYIDDHLIGTVNTLSQAIYRLALNGRHSTSSS